ncbi:MAG: type IV pilus twitching motility protein PilT, partial [bacterium]
TGPPSSGKTSTLAAIIEQVNQTKSKHVVSFERPIEFVYQNNKCIINQREVNIHTPSIESGLKASLMAPPDILVAERIDSPRAIRSALELADSGCLVIITLYTDSVISTIDFIINSFPDEEKDLIRLLLSKNLKGIVSQTLLLPKKGHKRVAAFEVLLYSPLVANLINTQKHNQIPGVIKSNKEHGMINLGDSLLEMVRNDQVSPEEAYEKSVDKIAFSQLLQMSSIKLDLNKRFYN